MTFPRRDRPYGRFFIIAWCLAATALFAVMPRDTLSAQSSPYVPNLDPAYVELDALIAAGLIHEVHHGQRPYSRMAFARMVREAQANADSAGEGELPLRIWEALERLGSAFALELKWICEGDEDCPDIPVYLMIREAMADFTWADSPWRAVPANHMGVLDTEPTSQVDARLNPLLEGNQGRSLVDGWTQGVEAGVEIQVGSRLAGYIRPRAWASGVREGDTDQDLALQEAYLRGVFGRLSLEVGRNHLFLGQGFSAGAVASHNPRGYDMVRLSSDRPFRLPWILGALGPASLSIMAADMGSDRLIPHSKLFVGKLSIRPHPNLELGATILNQQMGEGAPGASVGERLKDLLLPGIVHYQISEKMAGVDARLRFPRAGVEIYADGATTDINLHRAGEMVTDLAAWVWGVHFSRLGGEGRGSLRLEGHRVGVLPYTHSQFRSGVTLDQLLLGDPIGPLGTGVSGRFGWIGPTSAVALSGFMERRSGDFWQNNGMDAGDMRENRIQDNPDELRFRVLVEWGKTVLNGLRPSVRLGYERVSRFDFTGENRTNLLASAVLKYRW